MKLPLGDLILESLTHTTLARLTGGVRPIGAPLASRATMRELSRQKDDAPDGGAQ
jgi:hypothetical protein